MKFFKKTVFAVVISLLSVLAFAACGSDDANDGNQEQKPIVSYSFAKVNYHYQYNVLVENYWQESYSIVTGESYEITEFYTPPEKSGYTFTGYTLKAGGEGDLIELPFSITGSGGNGNIYNLYAKYVPIEYDVIYHLDGGENNADNPERTSGTVTLKEPTKDNCHFWGWFEDADFQTPITKLTLRTGEDTTIHCYAKWGEIYNISYSINKSWLKLHDQKRPETYTANSPSGTKLTLLHDLWSGYLFLGWTYEGQETPIRGNRLTEIVISSDTKGDLHFVANYIDATRFSEVGITTVTEGATCTMTVPADVKQIVIADSPDFSVIKANVVVRYYGDEAPEMLVAENLKLNITFEKIDEE